jgi:hypothetical protein
MSRNRYLPTGSLSVNMIVHHDISVELIPQAVKALHRGRDQVALVGTEFVLPRS